MTPSRGTGSVAVTRWPGAAMLTAATAAAFAWLAINGDRREDTTTSLSGLPWHTSAAVAVLLVLAAAHYLAAALSVRAVSNGRVGIRHTTYSQLAAAAVNRVVPAGIGALGVNLRYLTRSGLTPGAAASALGALAVVGGATDALYVGSVTALGPRLGAGGATTELHALTAAGVAAGQRHSSLIISAAVVAMLLVWLRRRGQLLRRLRSGFGQAAIHVRSLFGQPRQLANAAVSSLATTAVLSVAFVLTVRTWGSGAHVLPAGALVALYWVAVAAGTATPLPAFFGVTEAALISGLVLGGYTSLSATVAVLVFRGVTYWLPVPLGLWAGRTLRRQSLL